MENQTTRTLTILGAATATLALFSTGTSAAVYKRNSAPITITYANWQDSTTEKVIQQIANNFHKMHPNITVKLVDIPSSSYEQKILALAAGGDLYDVFDTGDATFYELAKAGYLANMSSVYKSGLIKKSDVIPQIYNLTVVNGQVMGLPQTHNTMVVYYNANLFQKAGLPTPQQSMNKHQWTWSTFMHDAQKIAALKGNRQYYGFAFDPSWWGGYYGWITANGGAPFNAKGVPTFASPKSRQALQYLYNGVKSGAFTVDSMLPQGMGIEQLFETGTVGMFYSGRWSLDILHSFKGFKWDIIPLPMSPAGHYGSTDPWANTVVNAKSPHLQAAKEWAAYFAGPKSMKTFVGWQGLPPEKSLNPYVASLGVPKHASYYYKVIPYAATDWQYPVEMQNPNIFTTLQTNLDGLLVGAKSGSGNVNQDTAALDKQLSGMIKH